MEYHIERIHNDDVYLDKQYFLRARLLLGFKKLEKITKYLLVPENFESIKKLDSGIKRDFADQLEDFKLGPPIAWVLAGDFTPQQLVTIKKEQSRDANPVDFKPVLDFNTTFLIVGKVPSKEIEKKLFEEQVKLAREVKVEVVTYEEWLETIRLE